MPRDSRAASASFNVIEAAQYLARIDTTQHRNRITQSINVAGVQAHVVDGDILIIPGTNEFGDWFRYNLDVFGRPKHDLEAFGVSIGDSGARWHKGFLEHAQTVFAFAKPVKPRLIIGHSLGAASAQIVGSSLKTPTIAFASPRPHRGKTQIRGEEHVINFCRSDDTVCHVPMNFLGFRHVGRVVWLNPLKTNIGEDHRIDEYLEIMAEAHIADILPVAWPDETRRAVTEALA